MKYYIFICILVFSSCSDDMDIIPPEPDQGNYFPDFTSNQWERNEEVTIDWAESDLMALKQYLEENVTRAFIMLIDGKIVIEEYWGNEQNSNTPFTEESTWYWASARSASRSISSRFSGP